MDALERLFKLAQNLGGRGPLHVPAMILHGSHVFEATVDLTDVRLDLVASVGLQDGEGSSHASVPHSGYSSSPHLKTRVHIKNT